MGESLSQQAPALKSYFRPQSRRLVPLTVIAPVFGRQLSVECPPFHDAI